MCVVTTPMGDPAGSQEGSQVTRFLRGQGVWSVLKEELDGLEVEGRKLNV